MKKARILAALLIVALVAALPAMVVSANVAGPFHAVPPGDYFDYYDEGGRDAFTVLQEALEGRTWIADPQFVAGSRGFGGDDGEEIGSPYGEWTWNMFDMTWWKYNQYGARRSSKYCGNEDMWWDDPHGTGYFFAIWRYAQAYVADAFLWANANDCEGNPRRMGDGWTVSGANSADGPWTVLYTGSGSDYENYNRTWWRVDLPGNTEAFQYYRLMATEPYDSGIIQLSNVALSGAPPAPEEPEAPAEVDADDAPPSVVTPEAAAAEAAKPAPPTVDPISVIAFGALASLTGALIAKKRKR